jgi:y4mF family transcriptional regulator
MASKSIRSRKSKSPPEWLTGLAGTVRAQRKRLGLTQLELSRLAGCGPVFLYDLERGTKPTLRLDKLVDVLTVLGLELNVELGKQGLRVSERLR